LRYADRDFSVAYSEALENALLEVIAGMRRIRGRAPDRSHEFPNRCQGCGYRQVCDQRLTVE
jgi:CRISPR/Cas system-associated exonuclease Cas4 (RecB family)